MTNPIRLGLVIVLGLIAHDVRPAAAQSDIRPTDRWQLALDDERYVWDVRLVKLAGDTLIVRQSDSLVRAPVARIREMRMFQKTVLRVGDVHQSAISAMTGGHDEVYELAQLDLEGRRDTIEKILSDHAPVVPE